MFKCKECKSTRSNGEMIGIIIGQISREAVSKHGVTTSASSDIIKGILNGYKIRCPKCNKHDWDYE